MSSRKSFSEKDCDKNIYCDCGKDIKYAKCEPLSPCPKRALIECGLPGMDIEITTTGQIVDTALVTVDTSCFKKPVVEINFSSQIDVMLQPDDGVTPPGSAEIVLRYDLICDVHERGEVVEGSWIYQRSFTADNTSTSQRLDTTDTFSFNKCLCAKPCQGCFDYFVRITAVKISVNNIIL